MSEIQTPEKQKSGLAAPLAVVAGVAAASLLTQRPARAATPAVTLNEILLGTGDQKVLNFALLLERLEAELYIQAVQRLSGGGNGGRDAVPGLTIVPAPDRPAAGSTSPIGAAADLVYYQRFRDIEIAHRDFLETQLAGAAIPVGTFKFDFNINNLTRRALLTAVLGAEATGVKAYLGALPLLASPALAQIAAAVQGTEARHTSVLTIVNNILVTQFGLGGAVMDVAPLANRNQGRDAKLNPQEVLNVVQGYIVRSAVQ